MNRILLLIVLLSCLASNAFSQELLDSVIKVKNLINQDLDEEASALLDRIESQCLDSDKDSIMVLCYENRGVILFYKDRYEECIPYFRKAINLYEKLNIRAQNYLEDFAAIGYSYGRLKDFDNAERYYRKALLKSVGAEYNQEFRPNVFRNLGNLYLQKGDSLLAKECFRRVGSADVEDFDFMKTNNLEWATESWEKINKLVDEKKYEEAANAYAGFIQGLKEKMANRSGSYITAVYSRAILLSRYLNHVDEAIPLFAELVNLADSFPAANKCICGAFCNLALCYSSINDRTSLEDIVPKGLAYLGKAKLAEYPSCMIYRFAGNGAYWQRNYPDAIKYYEKYIAAGNTHEGGNCYEEIVNQLSVSYIFMSEPEKAKMLLLKLLDDSEAKLKKEGVSLLAQVYHNIGRSYMLCGDKTRALKYLKESNEMQIKLCGHATERTIQYLNECQAK